MEVEDGIGLVLARASELRSKITNCIHTSSLPNGTTPRQDGEESNDKEDPTTLRSKNVRDGGEADNYLDGEEEEEEAETLLNIRDALESLEAQLNSLQALQQQQWYEKEAALAEIDYSRKKMLKKLREYKGKDLEVIREAIAFASETVEENNDLLLPPYPSRPSRGLAPDNGHLSHFQSTQKKSQNGVTSDFPVNESKASVHVSESKRSLKGVRLFFSAAAKTVITFVGFIAVLHLAGFEPKVRKRNSGLKVLDSFQQQRYEGEKVTVQCPPGKILVVEDGETRCLVKERVEMPFESTVTTPDVNYGCG